MNTDMSIMKHLHKIEETIYTSKSLVCQNTETADFLHDNLHKLSDEEKTWWIKKLITPKLANRLLLEYEFNNFTPTVKHLNLKKTMNDVNKLLNKYTHRCGGYYFESPKWDVYQEGCFSLFNVGKNEVWFVNTLYDESEVDSSGVDNSNKPYQDSFVNRLLEIIRKSHVDYKIYFKTKYYARDSITMTFIKMKKN